jgi:SAM-dependent methyltransferase
LANTLVTPTELGAIGQKLGLELVENRDLGTQYRIVELNYKNKKPDIKPFGGRTHQGWMGSKWRQRLTVEGKLTYNMIVLQKPGYPSTKCPPVPRKSSNEASAKFQMITPQLMSGQGNKGGQKMACISGWYCCDKGLEWYDNLAANRTDDTAFLKLDRSLFGHYINVFAKHLNEHYENYPASSQPGRFLDIGGTGSTASGMKQVTSKFQHFAGPLEYWKLDSDLAAKELERTIFCDIDDCPQAETCEFDVTFSHTVLEHAKRPWQSFDTIARITKQGGLTMHLVPFSYQYHATPDDNYRFSHKALTTLLEDRGFDVLEVGYDICEKPQKMLRRIDEHYDVIWLTYVVGRKR